MLDKLYTLPGCEKYYVQCSRVPEPVKGAGLRPDARCFPLPDFLDTVSGELIEKTKNQPYRAYYRLALRDVNGKPRGVTAVWVDVDTKKDDPKYINTKIEELQLPPSIIVWSGGGYHLYWLLDSACFDEPRINGVLGALGEMFGADMQQASIEGGLRLVGSLNWKYDHKPEVVILTENLYDDGNPIRYKITDFPYQESKKKPSTLKDADDTVGVFLRYFPEENPNKKAWLVSCPFHSDNDPSLSINLEKGVWYCHSPKHEGPKGGSALSFYAMMEGISIKDAKKEIGQKGDAHAAATHIVEQELRQIMEPLYTEGEGLVVVRNSDKFLFKIPMTSSPKMQYELSKIIGKAPIAHFGDMIPLEMKEVKNSVKALENVLKDACLNMVGGNLPDSEDMTFLGQGLHHVEVEVAAGETKTKTVLIDENEFKVWSRDSYGKYCWKTISNRPVYGKYLVRDGERWFPEWLDEWDAVLSPEELFDELYTTLKEAWAWRSDSDPLIVALYTMYAPFHTWFNKPLVLYIHGPSESGKSALAEGWFAGSRRGSIGMVPGAQYIRSTSLAGLYQSMRDRSQLLVLDEIGDQTNHHSRQIMEAMRNLESNNYSIFRGTPDGRSISYRLRMPIVWASIATPHLEQDINRIIEIQTKRQRGQEDPWLVINRRWNKSRQMQIAASVTRSLLPFYAKLQESVDRVRERVYAEGGIAYRRAEIMMPLLAIADMVGLDITEILNLTKVAYEESVENLVDASPYEQLREIILSAEIPYPNSSDMNTTMTERIKGGHAFENLTLGIFYKPSENLVGLIPLTFQTFLASKYRLAYGGYQLGKMFAQIPGYSGARQVRVGGRSVRAHLFDANMLLKGKAGADEVEEIVNDLLS